MRDKKGTHRFWGVLFYLALMVTIVSASYAGVRFCSNLVTEQSYERLRDAAEAFAVGTKNGQQGKEKNKAAKGMERESEAGDDRPEGIDFAELSSINPDIYAWIRIPDTQIDYPVLQREEDDTYYLRHNSSGRYAFAGSIYTEEANSRDFKDPMTVLYGHNMRDGSMFQNLHFFEDEEDYLIELQDNGVGFETLTYGYGLKQMMERISILGGQLQFESRDGFFTRVSLPKYKEGR